MSTAGTATIAPRKTPGWLVGQKSSDLLLIRQANTHIMDAIWTVEFEPEVEMWIRAFGDDSREFGHVAFYIDLLERKGVLLTEPYSRQLSGKLRELRFYLGRQAVRITYYIATGRRIIMLTVFAKPRQREVTEIKRAVAAMDRCIKEGHAAEEDQ